MGTKYCVGIFKILTFGESYDNSEMIHHNFENRYSGISLVSLADLKWGKTKSSI